MTVLDFKEYEVLFLQKLEREEKSFNTIKNYRTDLNIFKMFLKSKGRELHFSEITSTQILEYGEYLNRKYNSPNSIRRRVQALRIFFDFLISKGLFCTNPVKNMLVAPKVVDPPRPAFYNIVQKLKKKLIEISASAVGHEELLAQRNLLIFELIYNGGLKVSDIEKLHDRHITQAKNCYRIIISPEKRDPYTVSVSSEFNEVFQTYKALLEKGKNRDKLDFSNLLFNANPFRILKGGLSSRGIEIIFNEFSKIIDSQVTAKSLRQSCVFKWLCLQVPQSRIKEWMGVQPQYSLAPYTKLLKEKAQDYAYLEI